MRYEAVAVVGAVLMLASVGSAGEVYRWTDANGVLHISDVPPAGQRAQKQTLPDAPPLVAHAAAAPPGDGAAPPEGTPAAGQKPAQVVITGQDNESVGASQRVVRGTVENKGGTPARDVVIAVHVVSPAQGDECLEEEIAVASSLAPGEKAEFSEEFDHPCFRGPTQVDLRPQWE